VTTVIKFNVDLGRLFTFSTTNTKGVYTSIIGLSNEHKNTVLRDSITYKLKSSVTS